MSEPMFLTFNEVIECYRGQISEGTLRNWRSMRVGPSFLESARPFSTRLRNSIGETAGTHRLPAFQTTLDR
jgi:hypothetical protein